MLNEQGVANLDQPVKKHLPDDVAISTTPKTGATITQRQLASHTSGLPRGVPGRVQSVDDWYELEPQRRYDQLADVKLESDLLDHRTGEVIGISPWFGDTAGGGPNRVNILKRMAERKLLRLGSE